MKNLIKLTLVLILTPGLAYAGKAKKKFIEQKLLITPRQQAATKENIAKKLVAAMIVPAALNFFNFIAIKQLGISSSSYLQKIAPPEHQPWIISCKSSFNNLKMVPAILPGIRSIIAYYIAHRIILSRIEKANFLKFIKEWESNKKHTPKNLRYQFEQLYSTYKQNQPLDSKKINELKNRVKKLVQEKSSVKG